MLINLCLYLRMPKTASDLGGGSWRPKERRCSVETRNDPKRILWNRGVTTTCSHHNVRCDREPLSEPLRQAGCTNNPPKRPTRGGILLHFYIYVCRRGRVDTVVRQPISCTKSLAGPRSIPGTGSVNRTIHSPGSVNW